MTKFRFATLIALLGTVLLTPLYGQVPAPLRDQLKRIFDSEDFDSKSFGPAKWLADGDAYTTVEPSESVEDAHDIGPLRHQNRRKRGARFGEHAPAPGRDPSTRDRQLRVVFRSSTSARVYEHRPCLAAEHARRLLGPGRRERRFAKARRRGSNLRAPLLGGR